LKKIFIMAIALSAFMAGIFSSKIFFKNNESNIPATVDQLVKCSGELARAEEYYGKAFLLFLSSIGMKLNVSQNTQLQQVLKNPKDYIEQTKVSTETHIEAEVPTVVVQDTQTVIDEQAAENNSQQVQDSEEKSNLLSRAKKFEIENPVNYLETSKAMGAKDQQLLKVNGQYKGKLYILSGKRKGEIHQIDLNIAYTLEAGKKPDGQYYLELSRDDGPYSTTSGSGGNEDIRLNPKDPRAIILNASPSSFFHFANAELRLANFYDGGKKMGVAVFKRK
jgi:hypothetical protein